MAKHAMANGLMILAASFAALDCAAAERPIVVPIKLLGNSAFVSVNIDGNDVPLIFDSGSSGSIALTQAAIDRVKAQPIGETSRAMDAKGNVLQYPKFKIHRIQIGAAVFNDVIGELDVHDPSYQATQLGQQGFLGTGLLKKYKVVLDYRHRRMMLVTSDGTENQSAACQGTAVPFSRSWHGEPAAEVDIDLGRLTVWWDTGAPTSMLSKRFIDGVGLRQSGDTVTSKRLTLGGTNFGPLQFGVEDLSLPPGFDGFIGFNFFAHHIVCMDFPGKRLLIRD